MGDRMYRATLSIRKTVDLWSTIDVLVDSETEMGAGIKLSELIAEFENTATYDGATGLDELLCDSDFDHNADEKYDVVTTEYKIEVESIVEEDELE